MSKNKGETTLIIPGRETWELWSVQPGGKTELVQASEVTDVHDLKEMPAGETVLFFPVAELTFAPFLVETTDESLYDDLVSSHWEQLGSRMDPDDGVLCDYKVIQRMEDKTLLAPFSLAPQTESELPPRLPSHFDISPHAYIMEGNILVFRKELGRWVMSFYQEGQILYSSLLGLNLDEEAIRGVNMTLLQLTLQGTLPSSYKVELWNDQEIAFIPQMLNRPVHTRKHPSPVLPRVWSPILPADVHAERRKKADKRRIKVYVTALIAVYICGILFFYSKVHHLQKEVDVLKMQNDELNAPYALLEEVKAQWNALSPAIDESRWTLDILSSCNKARMDMPSIRFDALEIKNDEATGKPYSISIKGQADKPEFITKFGQRLKSSQYKLDSYKWETPAPVSSKEGSWTFTAQGTSLEFTPQQGS